MKKSNYKKKIITIIGTTASGKTTLAVDLAYRFNGEIISADSRQVYRGMDIGTGKDLDEYTIQLKIKDSKIKNFTVPYHLIDVADPDEEFDLASFQKMAFEAIEDILGRSKLPIIAGGTGLYTQAVVDNYDLSTVKPDRKMRQKLEKMEVNDIFEKLKRLNKEQADNLNESDKNNKRRLIRYVEVAGQGDEINGKKKNKYEYLILGLTWPREVLRKRISKRLIERLEKEDMVGEVERLRSNGLGWKRLESFGLEYKFIAYYLQKKISYDEMVERLNIAIGQFAKRQMSWYRRWEKQGADIHWLEDFEQAEKMVDDFLASN